MSLDTYYNMNFLRHLALWLSRWIDEVSWAVLLIDQALRPTTKILMVEQEDLTFLLQIVKGRSAPRALGAPRRFVDGRFIEGVSLRDQSRIARGQVEIVLAGRRFVFRSLELPRQASGFLDGIIRAQIDRLTPWSPSQVAFGCSPPKEISGDRINVIVAATARSLVMPFVSAVESFRPHSIIVSAAPDATSPHPRARIEVLKQQPMRENQMRRLRQILATAPALAGVSLIAAIATWVFIGSDLQESRLRIAKQVAERRVALLSGRGGFAEEATAALKRKKRETAANVIILESLSQALPDDTYLTELRVADGKLQITGVTHEAASLIGIIEQTDQFKHATFFAPTTRAPSDSGEQFHIEAQIESFFPTVQ